MKSPNILRPRKYIFYTKDEHSHHNERLYNIEHLLSVPQKIQLNISFYGSSDCKFKFICANGVETKIKTFRPTFTGTRQISTCIVENLARVKFINIFLVTPVG